MEQQQRSDEEQATCDHCLRADAWCPDCGHCLICCRCSAGEG